MPTTQLAKPPILTASDELQPLQSGDRLTRCEFERRYEAMPDLRKAELIEGVVYVPSPVRQRRHGRPHLHTAGWLAAYEAATPGVEAGDNSTVRLDPDNEPQPDLLLFVDPDKGGQVRFTPDDFLEGAPELVVEIAASSAGYDLNAKRDVYRRNGVREYVVYRVLDGEIDWLVLRGGEYRPLALDGSGLYKSEAFPGLWLDPAALVRGDLATVLTTLQDALSSPEHSAFVTRLGA